MNLIFTQKFGENSHFDEDFFRWVVEPIPPFQGNEEAAVFCQRDEITQSEPWRFEKVVPRL